MVARAGAILRHIDPIHPAVRRCGSLTLPQRRSAPRKPAGRQKWHYEPSGSKNFAACEKGARGFFWGGRGD